MSVRKRSLIVSPRAEQDLEDALLYGLNAWGERQKVAYKAAFSRALGELVEYPEIGRARDELGPGYRSRRVEQHVVYYRIEERAIRIYRILHVRRNVRTEMLE